MFVFGNGRLITFWDELPIIEDGAVGVNDSKIVEIGKTDDLLSKYSDVEFIDAHGGVIMPGLINAHTHISRALKMSCESTFFCSSFDKHDSDLRFESFVDFDCGFASAYAFIANAVRNGTTAVLDMFGCSDPRGMLFMLAGAAADIGIRAGLGFSVSAVNGEEAYKAACNENFDFIEYCKADPSELIRPIFAIDDLYTIKSDPLREVFEKLNNNEFLMISLSENPEDGFFTLRQYGCSPVKRLFDIGLLNENTLLAHCSCTTRDEAKLIAQSGAVVIHTPSADLLKSDKAPDIYAMIENGIMPCIGTDCTSDDVLTLPRDALACLVNNNAQDADRLSVDMLIKSNAALASRIFNKEIGIIKPGACADIIVLDYKPFTAINEKNLYQHILFGMRGSQCTHNMVNGRLLMSDRKMLTCKEKQCLRIIDEASKKIMASLKKDK